MHDDVSKKMAGVWRHTQPRARMYGDKREEGKEVVAVVAHHKHGRERGPSPPGCGGTAASNSCPCPTRLGGDGCRAFVWRGR